MAEDETWPFALESLLRGEGLDVEVLNFGVIGYTAVQGSALYLGRVRAYRPDIVVAAFETLHAAVSKDGGALVLVSPPRSREGEGRESRTRKYTAAVARVARSLDVPLADVYRRFRELEDGQAGGGEPLLQDAWHPTAAGHRVYAACVADVPRERGLLAR